MTDTTAVERRSTRSPTWIDAYIGRRIYQRRTDLGLSQSELGRRVGITFQQIQKFEIGLNRVAASRLADIAAALGASPCDFFPAGTQEAPDMRVSDLAQVLDAIDRILERHHLTIAELQRLQRRLRQIEMQMPPVKNSLPVDDT
jgi:transcriptional regulator with XRE-family HTH domain